MHKFNLHFVFIREYLTFFAFSAVYYEMKDYEKCIAACEKAVEVGRENRADFKLIAKALTRIGNAYKSLKVRSVFYLPSSFFFSFSLFLTRPIRFYLHVICIISWEDLCCHCGLKLDSLFVWLL